MSDEELGGAEYQAREVDSDPTLDMHADGEEDPMLLVLMLR
jgi:hypothetical protein